MTLPMDDSSMQARNRARIVRSQEICEGLLAHEGGVLLRERLTAHLKELQRQLLEADEATPAALPPELEGVLAISVELCAALRNIEDCVLALREAQKACASGDLHTEIARGIDRCTLAGVRLSLRLDHLAVWADRLQGI